MLNALGHMKPQGQLRSVHHVLGVSINLVVVQLAVQKRFSAYLPAGTPFCNNRKIHIHALCFWDRLVYGHIDDSLPLNHLMNNLNICFTVFSTITGFIPDSLNIYCCRLRENLGLVMTADHGNCDLTCFSGQLQNR